MEHRRPPTTFGSHDEERGVKEGTQDDRVRHAVNGGTVEDEQVVRALKLRYQATHPLRPEELGRNGGSGPVGRIHKFS